MIVRAPKSIGTGRKLVEDLARAGYEERKTPDGSEHVFARSSVIAKVKDVLGVPGSAELVIRGFAAPCALCRHLRSALARGADECGMVCGGPPSGRDFPVYEGPVPRDRLVAICFVCGDESEAAVSVGGGAPLGACGRHARWLEDASRT